MRNLSLRYIESSGDLLSGYWMDCHRLAVTVWRWAVSQRIVPRSRSHILVLTDRKSAVLTPRISGELVRWSYHAVFAVTTSSGELLIHDAWHPEVMDIEGYCASMFPGASIKTEMDEL